MPEHNAPFMLWTLYDHPTDFPGHYVARVFKDGVPDPGTFMLAEHVEDLHMVFTELELVWMPRLEGDDPVILGVYL